MRHVPDCLGDYRIFETIQFIQNALLETFCLKKEGGLQERGGKGQERGGIERRIQSVKRERERERERNRERNTDRNRERKKCEDGERERQNDSKSVRE